MVVDRRVVLAGQAVLNAAGCDGGGGAPPDCDGKSVRSAGSRAAENESAAQLRVRVTSGDPLCEGKDCGWDVVPNLWECANGRTDLAGQCVGGAACRLRRQEWGRWMRRAVVIAAGESCSAGGGCRVTCDPVVNCVGKQCGADGCGGVCGECTAVEQCSQFGHCTAAACEPSCAGRVCGDDGCGNCGNVARSGLLAGNAGCGRTAQCFERACGDDGCGGSCGTCEGESTCESGRCVAACTPPCGGSAEVPDTDTSCAGSGGPWVWALTLWLVLMRRHARQCAAVGLAPHAKSVG